MDNQLCAITEISDINFHLTRTSVFSFIEKNKWFTGKLYLLFHPDLPVSQKSIASILTIYKNIELVNCATKKRFIEIEKTCTINKNKSPDKFIDLYKNSIIDLGKNNILYFSNRCIFLKSIDSLIVSDNLLSFSNIFYLKSSNHFSSDVVCQNNTENTKINFASNFSDTVYSKSKNKLDNLFCLIFDTFSSNLLNFTKINYFWIHLNQKVTNFLNNPSAFTALLHRAPYEIISKIDAVYSSKFIINNETSSKFAIMITTCNRPSCVVQLTRRLKELDPTCKIIVVDDASVENFDTQYIDCYAKLINNNGKKRWWDTVNKLWSFAHMFESEYYIMLPDDSLPNENIFSKALDLWNSINDPRKIAMDLVNYDRIRNWTGFDRVDYTDELYLTQTTESSFLCIPEFIKYSIPAIPQSRWNKNPLLGSGVGDKLNNYWLSKGRTIYGAKKSLISANKNCPTSVMNPIARKINPWIIK